MALGAHPQPCGLARTAQGAGGAVADTAGRVGGTLSGGHLGASAALGDAPNGVGGAPQERRGFVGSCVPIRPYLDENIAEKIVTGRMDKFFGEVCLLEQQFVKNPDLSIQDLLNDVIAKMGENISVKQTDNSLLCHF